MVRSSILVIHGPNLNLLGRREPEVYGHTSLADIDQRLLTMASSNQIDLQCFQSNHEGQIVERIHQAIDERVSLIIVNPAAFTHTSVAIRDALLGVAIPFIEVHLSNIYRREPFRQHSYFSDQAIGVVSGFGVSSYEMAMQYALTYLQQINSGSLKG